MRALEINPEANGAALPAWEKPSLFTLPALLRGAFFLALLSYTIEGVLRFGLIQVGAEFLLYVRDLFLALIVVYATLREVVLKKIGPFGLGILLLSGHAAVGMLQLSNPLQVAFGLKLFLPILAGMAAAPLLFANDRFPLKFFAFLWGVCAAGILLDHFLILPWTGLSYSLMGHEIEGNRIWSTGGIERLSGFTRFSWDAAAQILLTFLLVVVVLRKNVMLKLIMWGVTAGVIGLTTTKGMIMAFTLCTVCLLAAGILRGMIDVRKPAILFAVLFCVTLPFLGTALDLAAPSHTTRLLFDSLIDRFESTWPDAVQQFQEHSPLIGGGIGSIGTPQKYFASRGNPGDNFYVYLLNIFGLFSLPYVMAVGWKSIRLVDGTGDTDRFFSYVALALFTAGIVINVIESPFLALFLGLLIGHLCAPKSLPART